MPLKRTTKKKIITQTRRHDKDTGSPEVQVSLLTKRIEELTGHLKDHKKDNAARRGLMGMVAKRRKHLSYLKMNTPELYEDVLKKNKLKK